MLGFFRTVSPLRMLVLLLLLLALRLPHLLAGTPLTLPEAHWLAVGERVSAGGVLYLDVWDNIGPLAAALYALLHTLFGKSPEAQQGAALLFAALQAVLFGVLLLRDEIFGERTFIPVLIYVLFGHLFFDFLLLSPVLMGLTFLLPALHWILQQIRVGVRDDELFFTGAVLGVAVLFHLPLVAFVALPLLALLLFSATNLRQYLLLLCGVLLPVALAFLYFYWHDAAYAFYRHYWATLWTLPTETLTGYALPALIVAAPVLACVVGLLLLAGQSSSTNYQVICRQVMVLWALLAGGALLLVYQRTPAELLIFLPPAAFFGAYAFQLTTTRWRAEVAFMLVLLMGLFTLYGLRLVLPTRNLWEQQSFLAPPAEPPVRGRRVLVLGPASTLYRYNTPATPYLNWDLSAPALADLDTYGDLVSVYRSFTLDAPEVIVDRRQVVSRLFARIPSLGERYRRGRRRGVYYLKTAEPTAGRSDEVLP